MDSTGTTCPPGSSAAGPSHYEPCERPVARQNPRPLTPHHGPGKAPVSSPRQHHRCPRSRPSQRHGVPTRASSQPELTLENPEHVYLHQISSLIWSVGRNE